MVVQKTEVVEGAAIVWIDSECSQKHLLRAVQLLDLQVDESEVERCPGIEGVPGQYQFKSRERVERTGSWSTQREMYYVLMISSLQSLNR